MPAGVLLSRQSCSASKPPPGNVGQAHCAIRRLGLSRTRQPSLNAAPPRTNRLRATQPGTHALPTKPTRALPPAGVHPLQQRLPHPSTFYPSRTSSIFQFVRRGSKVTLLENKSPTKSLVRRDADMQIARCMRTDSLSQAAPCRAARNGRRCFTRALETLERFEPASFRGSSGAPGGEAACGADHAQGEWNEHRGGRPRDRFDDRRYQTGRPSRIRAPSQSVRAHAIEAANTPKSRVVAKAALSRSAITALAYVANP